MRVRTLLANVICLSTVLMSAGMASAHEAPARAGLSKAGVSTSALAPVRIVPPMQAYQDRLARLTNAERTRRGLRPLRVSGCADGFADRWASRLAGREGLSHQSLTTVLRRCGARAAGENVAYGNVTPERMMAMWMASAGHRANILSPRFTHLGMGATTRLGGRVYAVQDFLA